MSDKIQTNRPLKGLSHLKLAEASNGENQFPISVHLPKDMYLHTPVKTKHTPDGCPTEWWWHTGTLVAENGRKFGFEINAAAFYPAGFTEVMLTDVQNQSHYQETVEAILIKDDVLFGGAWAESDPSQDWKVEMNKVSMNAPQADPTKNMKVMASLVDGGTTVDFDLTFSQIGDPFIVWGNGVTPSKTAEPSVATNNYYFSLTRLQAVGTIMITNKGEVEIFHVSGTTWMDHEWGMFSEKGKKVTWILQDMILDNGVCISNFSLTAPMLNQINSGQATVQLGKDHATCHYVATTMTPTKSWKDSTGREFFTEVKVEIPDYGGKFVVKTLMDDQIFTEGSAVYEGAGTVTGKMKVGAEIVDVTGTSWLEQTN